MVRIRLITEVACAPEVLFDLSLNVDAHLGSMAAFRETAIAGVTRGQMVLSDTVTWRAWHFGWPWIMTNRITAFDRPHRFVDERVRGPFAHFWHEHLFEAVAGGTRMTDRIDFVAPFGPVGALAERLLLDEYVTDLIRTRNRHLASLATTG